MGDGYFWRRITSADAPSPAGNLHLARDVGYVGGATKGFYARSAASLGAEGNLAMSGNLAIVLGRLDQVLGDYAGAFSIDSTEGKCVFLTVHDGGKQFEFAATPTEIVQHVLAFEDVPLWDPEVDTEDDGRWRLFAAHIKEAVETAGTSERMLVLVDGAASPRAAGNARGPGVP